MARKERRDDKKGGEEYVFPAPTFDEAAFMRREIEGAKVTLVTVGVGLLVGLLARLAYGLGTWWFGWLPIAGGVLLLPAILKRLGFSEDQATWKATLGNGFILFFTAFMVWVLSLNVPV